MVCLNIECVFGRSCFDPLHISLTEFTQDKVRKVLNIWSSSSTFRAETMQQLTAKAERKEESAPAAVVASKSTTPIGSPKGNCCFIFIVSTFIVFVRFYTPLSVIVLAYRSKQSIYLPCLQTSSIQRWAASRVGTYSIHASWMASASCNRMLYETSIARNSCANFIKALRQLRPDQTPRMISQKGRKLNPLPLFLAVSF